MCTLPARYARTLLNTGTCRLSPTVAGWMAAEQNGGVPVDAGTSVLLARPGPHEGWRAVCFFSANRRLGPRGSRGGLHDRWFKQNHADLMAILHCWDQTATRAPDWCCLMAQVTALAGAPPVPPPLGQCLLAHPPPQHPPGNWEFSIRWWAAQNVPTRPSANVRTDAFRLANAHQVAVHKHLPGWLNGSPAQLSQRLAAIGPCGCP